MLKKTQKRVRKFFKNFFTLQSHRKRDKNDPMLNFIHWAMFEIFFAAIFDHVDALKLFITYKNVAEKKNAQICFRLFFPPFSAYSRNVQWKIPDGHNFLQAALKMQETRERREEGTHKKGIFQFLLRQIPSPLKISLCPLLRRSLSLSQPHNSNLLRLWNLQKCPLSWDSPNDDYDDVFKPVMGINFINGHMRNRFHWNQSSSFLINVVSAFFFYNWLFSSSIYNIVASTNSSFRQLRYLIGLNYRRTKVKIHTQCCEQGGGTWRI